jgi:hypothetical protein
VGEVTLGALLAMACFQPELADLCLHLLGGRFISRLRCYLNIVFLRFGILILHAIIDVLLLHGLSRRQFGRFLRGLEVLVMARRLLKGV